MSEFGPHVWSRQGRAVGVWVLGLEGRSGPNAIAAAPVNLNGVGAACSVGEGRPAKLVAGRIAPEQRLGRRGGQLGAGRAGQQ